MQPAKRTYCDKPKQKPSENVLLTHTKIGACNFQIMDIEELPIQKLRAVMNKSDSFVA